MVRPVFLRDVEVLLSLFFVEWSVSLVQEKAQPKGCAFMLVAVIAGLIQQRESPHLLLLLQQRQPLERPLVL